MNTYNQSLGMATITLWDMINDIGRNNKSAYKRNLRQYIIDIKRLIDMHLYGLVDHTDTRQSIVDTNASNVNDILTNEFHTLTPELQRNTLNLLSIH